ncbi:CBN-DHS-24 protein [Aphelenchoides avenae]|nr:CBN-DHS-24 protein [Aphelenchus avenae]
MITQALKSPPVIMFSLAGVGYGAYCIIDSTTGGEKYDPEVDLTGKTYVVTGATSGIGKETAKNLAAKRAQVILACRDREKCIQTRRDIVIDTKNKKVYCRYCDLADFDSIRAFAAKMTKGPLAVDRIDGLVNNAAEMTKQREVNKDGIERMLATNHLGTFLLTGLLLDKLLQQENPSRIVFLNTNTIRRNAEIDFEDINSEQWTEKKRKVRHYNVYKMTKLAESLFAKELSERLRDTNVSVLMTDPGSTKTKLKDDEAADKWFLERWSLRFFGWVTMQSRKPEKAVKPVLYALVDPRTEHSNGVFVDKSLKEQEWPEAANDEFQRQKLWLFSEKWTNFWRQMQLFKEDCAKLEAKQTDDSKKGGDDERRTWRAMFRRAA